MKNLILRWQKGLLSSNENPKELGAWILVRTRTLSYKSIFFQKNRPICFPEWLSYSVFSSATYEWSSFSAFLLTFDVRIFYFSHSGRCVMISHYSFIPMSASAAPSIGKRESSSLDSGINSLCSLTLTKDLWIIINVLHLHFHMQHLQRPVHEHLQVNTIFRVLFS